MVMILTVILIMVVILIMIVVLLLFPIHRLRLSLRGHMSLHLRVRRLMNVVVLIAIVVGPVVVVIVMIAVIVVVVVVMVVIMVITVAISSVFFMNYHGISSIPWTSIIVGRVAVVVVPILGNTAGEKCGSSRKCGQLEESIHFSSYRTSYRQWPQEISSRLHG